jgi:hypothetical protein
MGGVHHEDGMKFETDGPRLDVAHAGEKQRGEDIPVRDAAFYARSDLFEDPTARRSFEQPDERLQLGSEANRPGIEFRLSGRNVREEREKIEVTQARQCARRGGGFQEGPARHYRVHGHRAETLSGSDDPASRGEQFSSQARRIFARAVIQWIKSQTDFEIRVSDLNLAHLARDFARK